MIHQKYRFETPPYPLRNHVQAAKLKMTILPAYLYFCANSVIMTFTQKANVSLIFCPVSNVKQ